MFAKDFRQFWEVVSNKEASVDMVDACLKGAYRLGITQPQYRCWLPLSKVGETMAILKIMHSNLCMDRGDLAQSVHDAQAAVALTIIPGSSACCPKAMSAMWFAQACRALGRVSVVWTSSVLPSDSTWSGSHARPRLPCAQTRSRSHFQHGILIPV